MNDSPGGWRTLHSETLADNPYWSYRRDRYQVPGGAEADYYYVHSPGAVLAVPLLDERTVLLVRQYRYLLGREGLEFPGGGRKQGLDPLVCAQAELQEEVGYRARSWQVIGHFNPCKGITDEWCSVFLCRDLYQQALATDDPFEVTTAEAVDTKQIPRLIADGHIWCGMTIAAWYLALGAMDASS